MQKRLYGDRFSVTAEPIFVKRYMKAIANRGFEKRNWTPALILIVSKLVSGYGGGDRTRRLLRLRLAY